MYYFCVFSEEEWKRYYQSLSEGYGAVGFSYDYHNHQHNSEYYQGGYYYKYTFIINLQKKICIQWIFLVCDSPSMKHILSLHVVSNDHCLNENRLMRN